MEFKHQIVQAHLGGETGYGMAKPHEIYRELIRVRIENYDVDEFGYQLPMP